MGTVIGVGTVKGVARKFGVHRRMVREALADAVPKERRSVERARLKLDPAVPFIDGILESDLKAPRKQRHTAHRIYNRLLAEKPEIPRAGVPLFRRRFPPAQVRQPEVGSAANPAGFTA